MTKSGGGMLDIVRVGVMKEKLCVIGGGGVTVQESFSPDFTYKDLYK